jgi:integrase/recombinase XerD
MNSRAEGIAVSPATEQFLQHGIYLRGWSPRTVATYRLSFRECPAVLSKATLNEAVVAMRSRGLSAGGINLRIRSINSFLTWLHEEGHLAERLRIRLLKNPPKPVTTLSSQDIRSLSRFHPKGRIQVRSWTLAMLLLDSGLRINEALGLMQANLDLDQLVMRVRGKGNRERLVPMSLQMRKHLFRLLRTTKGSYVFESRGGSRLGRHHAYRDLRRLCAAGSVRTRVHPHCFRHTFAAHCTRNGLDLFRLSRILGHSNITTTEIYLRSLGIEHLREGLATCSPLETMAAAR